MQMMLLVMMVRNVHYDLGINQHEIVPLPSLKFIACPMIK